MFKVTLNLNLKSSYLYLAIRDFQTKKNVRGVLTASKKCQ